MLKDKNSRDGWSLTIDGSSCIQDGCMLDENIISVIVPKKFKIARYESFENKNYKYEYNKDANFKLVDNTLTLFAKDVKGAYIKLWLTGLDSKIYDDVSDSFKKHKEINV